VATTPSFELVGRERELATLVDFVAQLHEGPAALLIHGEPGIGKTILWREGVAAAEREGVRVLVSRCAEAEMPIPFGALSDLIGSVYDDVADDLPDPQRTALAVALGIESDARGRPDRLALPRALVAALHDLADDGPLLLAIDDVQWLDTASARALTFAARRLDDSPIGVLVTLRGGVDEPDPLQLADAFDTGWSELVLGPLSFEGIQRLLRDRSDIRVPRARLGAVHAASGGNPMFALEFARVAEREDGSPTAVFPVPSSLQELVQDRVSALPPRTRPLLELVSATERPTAALLDAAFGETTEPLIDEAVSAGAIGVGSDGIVRFTHPLLGSSVYFGMTAARRRAVHRELAGVVDDLEQRARHLALSTSGPDVMIADAVERAAAAAAGRGAPDAAALLASEAVRLTPSEDEPARVRRILDGVGYLIEAGDLPAAQAHIETLLEQDVPADIRSQALLLRAETERRDRASLRACLSEALDIAPDPRVRSEALLRRAQHEGWISGDLEAAADSAREAHLLAVGAGDGPLVAAAAAAAHFYERARGRRDFELDEGELLQAALPHMAPWQVSPAISVGAPLLWAGELAAARDVLAPEREDLLRRGNLLRMPSMLLVLLFDIEWRAGRWAVAEAYAEEAQAILLDAAFGGVLGRAFFIQYTRVLSAGSQGRVVEARELAAEALDMARRAEDAVNMIRPRWALGHVELSRGDAAAAWQSFEGLPRALDDFGFAEPGWQPILPDVIEALVALGRLDEAEVVLEELEGQAAALDHRWAAPAALRGRALLMLAREQADEAAEAAERAAAAFEELGFPLDHARALIAQGAARRRAGERRRAAEALRQAVEVLTELGAPLWLERAEEELRRASPRPRRDRELTDAERRVASLVAQGQTNREVAAQLFTTVGTVEQHLTRIYRKLGIRSRTQLARAAADGTLHLD
jgi:DNA-binding NarL/FixJ family response regulator